MNINEFIVKNRIIRRILVFALTYLFIKVTVNLFSDLSSLNTQAIAGYTILAGLEREILRFFCRGTKEEADAD